MATQKKSNGVKVAVNALVQPKEGTGRSWNRKPNSTVDIFRIFTVSDSFTVETIDGRPRATEFDRTRPRGQQIVPVSQARFEALKLGDRAKLIEKYADAVRKSPDGIGRVRLHLLEISDEAVEELVKKGAVHYGTTLAIIKRQIQDTDENGRLVAGTRRNPGEDVKAPEKMEEPEEETKEESKGGDALDELPY